MTSHFNSSKLSNFKSCGLYGGKGTEETCLVDCRNCHRTHFYRGVHKKNPLNVQSFNRKFLIYNEGSEFVFTAVSSRHNKSKDRILMLFVFTEDNQFVAQHLHISITNEQAKEFAKRYPRRVKFKAKVIRYWHKNMFKYTLKVTEVL